MDPAVREGLARSWKTLMAVGVLAIFVGCIAILVPAVAAVGTAIFIGWILRHRRRLPGRRRLLGALDRDSLVLRLVWAALTVIVGVWLIVEPHNGTLTLTLVLGIYFLFMGLTRIAVAFVGRGQQGAGLVGLSGVCGLLIGILVLAKFPQLGRLGDRPPGRHRPDLRRLDADLGRPGRQRPRAQRLTDLSRRSDGAGCRREYDSGSEFAPGPGHGGGRRARACVPRRRRCCIPSAGGRWSPGRSSPPARPGAGRVAAIVSPGTRPLRRPARGRRDGRAAASPTAPAARSAPRWR